MLFAGTISNISNSVIGYGYSSLLGTSISNTNNVLCIGDSSCNGTIITSVSNIIVLSGSSITSDLEGNILIVEINGTSNDIFELHCNLTDTCYIDCQSHEACRNLRLNCGGDGNCNLIDTIWERRSCIYKHFWL